MARPHADLFDWAKAQAASLPMRLTIELRLARLEAEMEMLGVPAGDPRVRKMISALFPPGSNALPAASAGRAAASIAAPPSPEATGSLSATGLSARWKGFIRRFGLAALAQMLAPVLLLFAASDAPPPPPKPIDTRVSPPPSNTHPETVNDTSQIVNLAYYQRMAGIMGAGLALWLFLFLRRQRLIREQNPDLAPVLALSTKLARTRLFDGPSFEKALSVFRLHHRTQSQRIDLRKTLRATVSRAGFPTFVFGERRVPPDYLVLSERQSPDDHLTEIGKAFHARLGEAQISSRHFEYFGAPYRLGTAQAGGGLAYQALDTVMSRYLGGRALIVEESYDLKDDLDDPQLLATLGTYHSPILFNPREPDHWNEAERDAADAGIGNIFLGDVAGEDLGRVLARSGTGPGTIAQEDADLPAFLAEEGNFLLSEARPESMDVDALIANLAEHWLNPAELLWLRTIALFPAVHVGFSYFAAIALDEGRALAVKSALPVFRLPWLRAGYMPDWLREALVRGLSPEAFAQAKTIVIAFFSPEAAKALSTRDIIKVCDRSRTAGWRRRFARQLAGAELPALRDALLQDAFTRSDPLDVEIGKPRTAKRHWWLRPEVVAAAFTLPALGALYFFDARTIEQTSTQTKWVEDKPVSPTPTPTPAPTASSSDRTLYVHIANPLDANSAGDIVDELRLIRFSDGPIIISSIQYRQASPSQTEVRCFTDLACANGPEIVRVLRTFGIKARLNDGSIGKYAGSRALELWFADKDLPDSQTDSSPKADPGIKIRKDPKVITVPPPRPISCERADVNNPETANCTCPAGTVPSMAPGSKDIMQCALPEQTEPVSPQVQQQAPPQSQPPVTIKEAQQSLTKLGFYKGPIDGYDGRETRYAVQMFQESKSLPPTGQLDAETVSILSASVAASTRRP